MTITDLPPLFEVKADDDDSRERQQHTGAMIALRPRQDHIDRLALTDGEPPEELHTTILFMGKAKNYSYDTRDRIIQAMREVAQRFRMVTGNGFAINAFNPNGEEPCIVLGVGGSELVDIRNAIVQALQGFDLLQVPEQHEPWVPHITLEYTDDTDKVSELTDLTGEVVYDAIRVAFGGIVDDIPLQQTATGDDGYAGGNRYSAVPLTVIKNFRTQRIEIKNSDHCRYCSAKATKKVGVDGGAFIRACDSHADEAHEDADGIKAFDNLLSRAQVLEEKAVRHVRTAAGVRKFGQPIGSVIVGGGGGGNPLKNLKEQASEYHGYNKYSARGKTFYTHKNGDRFEALDQNDNVIASNASEEDLLRDLDSGKLSTSRGHVGLASDQKPGGTTYSNFKRVDSEYEGYVQYETPGGDVWRDPKSNVFYDKDDNELSSAQLQSMNDGKRSTAAKSKHEDPAGLKKVESDYEGYDKFMGQNGEPVYRDHSDGKLYDADDNEIVGADINKYNGEMVKADLTKKPTGKKTPERRSNQSSMRDAMKDVNDDARAKRQAEDDKKPLAVDVGPGKNTSVVSPAMRKRAEKLQAQREAAASEGKPTDTGREDARQAAEADRAQRQEAGMQAAQQANAGRNTGGGPVSPPAAGNQPEGEPTALRANLVNPDAAEDLDTVLGKIQKANKKVSSGLVEELRRVALRQSDVRNRRKLMLYAQQLADAKAFEIFLQMDYKLRAHCLEYKLVTPGGRIGTDKPSGSRSNGENWVERSKVGGGKLPRYIRIVMNGLLKAGHSRSKAIALAVAAMKRWAAGGNHVSPKVQAAAAEAVAQWEAMKAQS